MKYHNAVRCKQNDYALIGTPANAPKYEWPADQKNSFEGRGSNVVFEGATSRGKYVSAVSLGPTEYAKCSPSKANEFAESKDYMCVTGVLFALLALCTDDSCFRLHKGLDLRCCEYTVRWMQSVHHLLSFLQAGTIDRRVIVSGRVTMAFRP